MFISNTLIYYCWRLYSIGESMLASFVVLSSESLQADLVRTCWGHYDDNTDPLSFLCCAHRDTMAPPVCFTHVSSHLEHPTTTPTSFIAPPLSALNNRRGSTYSVLSRAALLERGGERYRRHHGHGLPLLWLLADVDGVSCERFERRAKAVEHVGRPVFCVVLLHDTSVSPSPLASREQQTVRKCVRLPARAAPTSVVEMRRGKRAI